MGEEFRERIRTRLGVRLYSQVPRPLEEWIGERLTRSGLTLAVAESCTAGLITARLASVPGSSAYLHTGFVTYANLAKRRCLEVTDALLANCGAVSQEVALAMARGALRAADCDLSVAVTGVAGPGGGSEQKPVGTVFLAACARDGGMLEHRGFFVGSRDRIRLQSSQTALHLLRRLLINQG
ncbi:MAG: nicotinamide-nucleotide amidohydrolase family protein [Magnetococcales bacterium]|nr:nicotinamide-nucleotide amidohydrolase family protein [Magnetococcales bacterium]